MAGARACAARGAGRWGGAGRRGGGRRRLPGRARRTCGRHGRAAVGAAVGRAGCRAGRAAAAPARRGALPAPAVTAGCPCGPCIALRSAVPCRSCSGCVASAPLSAQHVHRVRVTLHSPGGVLNQGARPSRGPSTQRAFQLTFAFGRAGLLPASGAVGHPAAKLLRQASPQPAPAPRRATTPLPALGPPPGTPPAASDSPAAIVAASGRRSLVSPCDAVAMPLGKTSLGCSRRAVRPATAPASTLPGPGSCGASSGRPLLLPAAACDQPQEHGKGAECLAAQGPDADGAAGQTAHMGRRTSAPVQAAPMVAPVQAAEHRVAAPGRGASRRRRSGKPDRLHWAGAPPAAGSHKPQGNPEAAAAIQAAAADARWRALAVGLLLTPRSGLPPLGPCSRVLTHLSRSGVPPRTPTVTEPEPESLLPEDQGARALLPRSSTGPGRSQYLEGAWSAGSGSADEKAQGPCMRAADALHPAMHSTPPPAYSSVACASESEVCARPRAARPASARAAPGPELGSDGRRPGWNPARPCSARRPTDAEGRPPGGLAAPAPAASPRVAMSRARALALLLALRPARAVQARSLSTSQELLHARAPRAIGT